MAKAKSARAQFVVLPTRGLRAMPLTSSSTLGSFLVELNGVRTARAARSFVARSDVDMSPDFTVLDHIHEDGAKLVEMSPETAKDLQASQPGLRIVPVVYYWPARAR